MDNNEVVANVRVLEKVYLGDGRSVRGADYITGGVPAGDQERDIEKDGEYQGQLDEGDQEAVS